MRGWRTNENVDFHFKDSHDLGAMTSRAQNEAYVKSELRKRMEASVQVMVMVGKATRYQYRYIRWELDLALELGLPIIAVNLNGKRLQDDHLCPPIIRDRCVVHVAYKMAIMKHALAFWPNQYAGLSFPSSCSWFYYENETYQRLGIGLYD